jgi:hypothetical protein
VLYLTWLWVGGSWVVVVVVVVVVRGEFDIRGTPIVQQQRECHERRTNIQQQHHTTPGARSGCARCGCAEVARACSAEEVAASANWSPSGAC